MRLVARLSLILTGLYVLLASVAFLFQAHLVYFPDATPATVPDDLPIEALRLDTEDGESIVAWQMRASQNCPTMLMFHGNAGHLEKESWYFRRLRDAGVGVFAVSWRGYAGSSGTPSEAGLFADSEAAYQYLRSNVESPNEIVIHGFSLGSGPATRLASIEDAGALILEAPYYSALKLAEEKIRILPVRFLFRHNYRSDLFITDVDERILIVHGSADSVIPARHSEALASRARSPITRIVLDGSDHNTLVRDGLYETAIWPFLKPLYPDCSFGSEREEI